MESNRNGATQPSDHSSRDRTLDSTSMTSQRPLDALSACLGQRQLALASLAREAAGPPPVMPSPHVARALATSTLQASLLQQQQLSAADAVRMSRLPPAQWAPAPSVPDASVLQQLRTLQAQARSQTVTQETRARILQAMIQDDMAWDQGRAAALPSSWLASLDGIRGSVRASSQRLTPTHPYPQSSATACRLNPTVETQACLLRSLARENAINERINTLQSKLVNQAGSSSISTLASEQCLNLLLQHQQLSALQKSLLSPVPDNARGQSQLLQRLIQESFIKGLGDASLPSNPRLGASAGVMAVSQLSANDSAGDLGAAFASKADPAGGTGGAKVSQRNRWLVRYEELKQFQRDYGHCRVPHGYPVNRKLSWWVMNQRAQYQLLRRGKKTWLNEDRVALLDELGFDWTPTARGRGVGSSDESD